MQPQKSQTHEESARTPRRTFLKSGIGLISAALAAEKLNSFSPASHAVEPIHDCGAARIRSSLAAYSFRNQLQSKDPAEKIDLFRFMDFCVEQGCDAAELTSYYFESTSSDYILQLKRHAFLLGLDISGTAVGNNFALPYGETRDKQIADVKAWIERAALLGAPHIRIFAGPNGSLDFDRAKSLCVEAIQECADYAAKYGVFLGIENHGGIVSKSEDLIDIVKKVNSAWVGINLDTGNFHTADPYQDLEHCAPWAVNVQLKVEVRAAGQSSEETDYDRIFKILEKNHYKGYVALEYEASANPWKSVPEYLQKMYQQMK